MLPVLHMLHKFFEFHVPMLRYIRHDKMYRQIRIIRSGIMNSHQIFSCPIIWKYTCITNIHVFILNPNLDWNSVFPFTMNQRIIDSLTNRFSCKRIGFYPNIILIGYFCFQIFEINQIYNPIRNQYQRTLNNILILKIYLNQKLLRYLPALHPSDNRFYERETLLMQNHEAAVLYCRFDNDIPHDS